MTVILSRKMTKAMAVMTAPSTALPNTAPTKAPGEEA